MGKIVANPPTDGKAEYGHNAKPNDLLGAGPSVVVFSTKPVLQEPNNVGFDGSLRAEQQQRRHQQADNQMEMGIEIDRDPPVEGDGEDRFGNRQDRNLTRVAGFRRRPPDTAFLFLRHACSIFEIRRGFTQDTLVAREPFRSGMLGVFVRVGQTLT